VICFLQRRQEGEGGVLGSCDQERNKEEITHTHNTVDTTVHSRESKLGGQEGKVEGVRKNSSAKQERFFRRERLAQTLSGESGA